MNKLYPRGKKSVKDKMAAAPTKSPKAINKGKEIYPRGKSVGGGGQPFISPNYRSPVRNTPVAKVKR